MTVTEPVLGIACGIFVKELECLVASGELNLPFIFLNSTLHMHPEALQTALSSAIEESLGKYQKIILVYGDCHPYMYDAYDEKRVTRVKGINCCEIMLGRDTYRRLRKQGVFFVLNEWAHKWNEIFVDEMGLTDKTAPPFMNSMHTGIVYLDTGLLPIPYETLAAMSAYFDLPYRVEVISLDFLKAAILEALCGE